MEVEELQQQQQQQQQPMTRITTCERHPDVAVIGLCALCLNERLVDLEAARRSVSSKADASASSVLKSIFFRPSGNNQQQQSQQLRRCKSFSGGRREGLFGNGTPRASSFEPQRRSCDVRGRSTLWSLFHQDDHRHPPLSSSLAFNAGNVDNGAAAMESKEEEDVYQDAMDVRDARSIDEEHDDEEEDDLRRNHRDNDGENEHQTKQRVDEDEVEDVIQEEEVVRPIKEHIHLDVAEQQQHHQHQQQKKPPPKDLKEIAGSFWLAASVFSKKLQKWRRKQKLKKQQSKEEHHHLQQQQQQYQHLDPYHHLRSSSLCKPLSSSSLTKQRQQPPRRSLENGNPPDDVFGRRSCDVVPRFSLDAGRVSFDDPRCSWDEPRASWDGYLIGGGVGFNNNNNGNSNCNRSIFSRPMAMLSVMEDEDNNSNNSNSCNGFVQRSDGLIPVEEEDLSLPGGAHQTRDYYGDFPQQRRRRSLDRSTSKRYADHDLQPPTISNAGVGNAVNGNGSGSGRVSFELPANDSFHYSTPSLRDEWSESFDSGYIDHPLREGPPLPNKPRRRWTKAWNIWGFIQRRSNARGGNGVERSMSETWPEFKAYSNARMLRSNSTVSSRSWHSGNLGGGFGGGMRGCNNNNNHNNNNAANNYGFYNMDVNGGQWHSKKKRRDEFVLERNRSARYSPANNADSNGMLRFYLPPMRSGRRGGRKSVKEGFRNNVFPRSVLQLY